MRPGRLIVLALVVLGLGAWIYFSERHTPTTDERRERADRLFPAFEREQASRITIDNPHGRFELVKEQDDWKLVAPLADDADAGAVSALLASLASLKAERKLPASEVRLADYGLDAPPVSVMVEAAGGRSLELKLGNELPLGTNRAAMTDGAQVYFVSKHVGTDLDRELSGWRSIQLARVMARDVASLTLASAGARVALAQSGGVWRLTEPLPDLAERDRAEGLIGDLSAAQIKEFVDAPGSLAALGLEPPRLELIIVRREAGAPLQLAFGNEREQDGVRQVACRRGERVLWVEAAALEHAAPAPLEAWRAHSLVALETWNAESLELTAGEARAAVTRDDGVWKAGATEVDGEAVSRRLRTLADLQVVAFDRPRPTGSPLGSVKVRVDEGDPIEVSFHRGPLPGQALAVVEGRAGALAVDAVRVGELLADPAALALPRPTPVPLPTAGPSPDAGPSPEAESEVEAPPPD